MKGQWQVTWLDDFVFEFIAFPAGKNDDQVDALSQFLNWRTTAEKRTTFSADFGGGSFAQPEDYGACLGAPSAEELFDLLHY